MTNEEYVPFKHLTDSQATFDVYDSLLNEYAALGFEYGYSVAAPEALVLWVALTACGVAVATLVLLLAPASRRSLGRY